MDNAIRDALEVLKTWHCSTCEVDTYGDRASIKLSMPVEKGDVEVTMYATYDRAGEIETDETGASFRDFELKLTMSWPSWGELDMETSMTFAGLFDRARRIASDLSAVLPQKIRVCTLTAEEALQRKITKERYAITGAIDTSELTKNLRIGGTKSSEWPNTYEHDFTFIKKEKNFQVTVTAGLITVQRIS